MIIHFLLLFFPLLFNLFPFFQIIKSLFEVKDFICIWLFFIHVLIILS